MFNASIYTALLFLCLFDHTDTKHVSPFMICALFKSSPALESLKNILIQHICSLKTQIYSSCSQFFLPS